MLKGLMDRCVSHETALGRLRERLGTKEIKVQELLAWKNVQIGKLDLTKQLLKESKEHVEALKKIPQGHSGRDLGCQKSTSSS